MEGTCHLVSMTKLSMLPRSNALPRFWTTQRTALDTGRSCGCQGARPVSIVEVGRGRRTYTLHYDTIIHMQ